MFKSFVFIYVHLPAVFFFHAYTDAAFLAVLPPPVAP